MRNANILRTLCGIALALTFTSEAMAADLSTKTPTTNSAQEKVAAATTISPSMVEVDHVNSDLMVLDARLKKLETEAKIKSKQHEILNLDNQYANVSSVMGMPSIKSIEGIGDKLIATLIFPEGGEFDAVTGDVLPNGAKIVSVKPGNVSVQSGKKIIRLGFATTSNQTQGTTNQNQVPGLPNVISGAN